MYIEEGSIICILTSYKHNQGVLELKEEELFYFRMKFNKQVISSILQNQQKFVLMNMM